jgi:hypothetical protein
MMSQIISKPIYQVLSDLTQEPRVEVALPLAIKDWVRLKLNEATRQRLAYERRYGMDFFTFKHDWEQDAIANKHTYEVEQDYWEWEAAVTDEQRLKEMLDMLA